jgi:hypothetical protein
MVSVVSMETSSLAQIGSSSKNLGEKTCETKPKLLNDSYLTGTEVKNITTLSLSIDIFQKKTSKSDDVKKGKVSLDFDQ